MARTTLWFAAALSAAPTADAGLRGSHGVRTRRAESMLDPADGAQIATMPTPSTDTEELVLNPLKEPMWYSVEYEEGKRYCRYDAHYPGQLLQASMSGLLHKTREMCCYANPGACEDHPVHEERWHRSHEACGESLRRLPSRRQAYAHKASGEGA